MKKIIVSKCLLFIVMIFSFSCKNDSKGELKDDKLEKTHKDSIQQFLDSRKDLDSITGISLIKSFYKDYIDEYNKLQADPDIIESILEKYCSKELLKKFYSYEYLEYNPFINGQDYAENFIDILKIKNNNKGLENRYIIYQTNDDVDYELLEMEVLKITDSLKINNLYFPDGSEMLEMQKNE